MTKFVAIGYGDRAGYDEFALRALPAPLDRRGEW